tara:strand:- start:11169 stop:11879 length:711 start_codon:yes stop_codon:yes gene_type:complete
MEKKSLLAEELRRHMGIIKYADKMDGGVIEEKFKITFQEQEPPEVEPGEEIMGELPPLGGEDTLPIPPPPGDQEVVGVPAPGEQEVDGVLPLEGEVEEIDVTDLVNKNNEMGDTVDKFTKQLSDIESKFSELTDKLGIMDDILGKISSLEDNLESMAPPTAIEKMELRSLDSFPYNQRLDDYFESKKQQYKRLRGVDLDTESREQEEKEEYVLKVSDVEDYDDNSIGKSFNPKFEE